MKPIFREIYVAHVYEPRENFRRHFGSLKISVDLVNALHEASTMIISNETTHLSNLNSPSLRNITSYCHFWFFCN